MPDGVRASSFTRNTQRRLSLRRRQTVDLGNNNPIARIKQISLQMTRVSLPDLSLQPDLQRHITAPADGAPAGANGGVKRAERIVVGPHQFIYFEDAAGPKLYVNVRPDNSSPNKTDAGELTAAALQRVSETNQDAADIREIILQRLPPDEQELVIQEIRRVLGEDIPITLTPPEAPPPVPERPDEDQLQRILRPNQPAAANALDAGLRADFQSTAPPKPPRPRERRFNINENVPPINSGVSTLLAFSQSMGKVEKQEGGRRGALEGALKDFHESTRAYTEGLRQANANTPPQVLLTRLEELKQGIVNAKARLDRAAQDYLDNSRTARIPKAKLEKFRQKLSSGFENPKLAAVRDLQTAVQNVNVDAIIRDARNQAIVNTFHPLLNSDQDTTRLRIILGRGTNGEVTAVVFNTGGRDGLPASFTAARKMDGAVATDPARNAGIPVNNPQQAQRAVASYLISRAIGMDNVPVTAFVVAPDANGDLRLGQALEVVSGTDGQIEVDVSIEESITRNQELANNIEKEIERQNIPDAERDAFRQQIMSEQIEATRSRLKSIADDLNSDAPIYDDDALRGMFLKKRSLPDGTFQVVPFIPKVVDLPYQTDGIIQRGLANLQLLDVIIGHPDRNGGNYKFEISADPPHRIIAVKALDNDDALGFGWKARTPAGGHGESLTPGLPPLVDFRTALSVLEATQDSLATAKRLLSESDAAALGGRLIQAQDDLTVKLLSGEFASDTPLVQADYERLASILKLQVVEIQNLVGRAKIWGPDTFKDHVVREPDGTIGGDSRLISYLGEIAYRAQPHVEDTARPNFKTLP